MARGSGESCGLAPEEPPCPLDMTVLGPNLTEGDADGESATEPRVRQEHLAGSIDCVDERLVQRIQARVVGLRRLALNPGGRIAETDGGERDRREPFEIWIRVHPRGEGRCLF